MVERARSGGLWSSVRRWFGGRPRPQLPTAAAGTERNAPPDAEHEPRVAVLLAEWQDIRESLRAAERQRLAQLALFLLVSVVVIFIYLPIATATTIRWAPARWALPAFGVVLALLFLALELGLLAYRREWSRRGRQIETALQLLVPGIGHVSSLALLTEFDPETSARVRLATAAVGVLYALMLLAWGAALAFTALA